MKRTFVVSTTIFALLSSLASADSFGTFDIDFVTISGSTNPNSGLGIVNNDYRMGKYEITNDQWTKFKAAYGAVTGTPTAAYDSNPTTTGLKPTNYASWYEAAQFVNFLNTSTGHTAAYKFTGTIHTSNYALGVWSASDAGYNAANPYRNINAKYFLPTENEWVKAAYWNGSALQTYATKAGESLYQGNGTNGGWNYYNNRYATNPYGPWAVGSGSQELNGTYDMMGNVWEWMESPFYIYSDDRRGIRGGSFDFFLYGDGVDSSYRNSNWLAFEDSTLGFRVASIVPEPCSLILLFLGGLVLRYRKR